MFFFPLSSEPWQVKITFWICIQHLFISFWISIVRGTGKRNDFPLLLCETAGVFEKHFSAYRNQYVKFWKWLQSLQSLLFLGSFPAKRVVKFPIAYVKYSPWKSAWGRQVIPKTPCVLLGDLDCTSTLSSALIVTTAGDLMKMLWATFESLQVQGCVCSSPLSITLLSLQDECGCWLFLFAACLCFCFLLTTQGRDTGRHPAELSLGTL